MEHKSDLTGEYEEIRKLAEQIAKDRIAPGASERDLNHTFPSDCIRILGETGFLGLIVSEDLGGFGVGRKFFASAIEEISMACASTALVLVSHAIVAKALELAADEAVAKLFASEVAVDVANKAIQVLRGHGYCRDYVVERLFRDARGLMLHFKTSEWLRQDIAKAALGL